MGALLAILRSGATVSAPTRRRIGSAALLTGVAILAGVAVARYRGAGYRLPFSFSYTGYALVALWLIDRGADGFKGPVKRVLESGPLVYLGKISYGIYVFHLPIRR